MIDNKEFYIKEREVSDVSEEEYKLLEESIPMLDAFARTTYASIYVIDFFRKNFLYVSDNPLFLCGLSSEEVKEMGYEFYIHHVIDEDLHLLLEIDKIGFDFTESVFPFKNRLNYTLSYDFHLEQASGRPMLINHKITPFRLAKDGRLWLGLCTVSLSSNSQAGNMEILCRNSNKRLIYDMKIGKWNEQVAIQLKDIEKEVLRLSAQGYTMNQISELLFKSFDTIKVYRKQILEKLGVDNITEAVSYIINRKLI